MNLQDISVRNHTCLPVALDKRLRRRTTHVLEALTPVAKARDIRRWGEEDKSRNVR